MIRLLAQLVDVIIARFRTPELPAFTVNLDDSEARWNAEAKDEWDLAFRGAVGWLPAFSRLEAERLKGASPAVAESELRRQQLRAQANAAYCINVPVGSTARIFMKDNIICESGAPIRIEPPIRIGPIEAPWNLMAAPNAFVPSPEQTPFAEHLARYNELLANKSHGD